MTFKQLLVDPRFQESDLDSQLGYIDNFYRASISKLPDQKDALELEGRLMREGYEQKALARKVEGDERGFHLRKFKALNEANRARLNGDMDSVQEFLKQREIIGQEHLQFTRQKENLSNVDRMAELMAELPLGGKEIKGATDLMNAVIETGLKGPQYQAARKLVGADNRFDKFQEGITQLRAEVGEEEFKALTEQVKKEVYQEFEGNVHKSRWGDPVIKPRLALEDDAAIKSSLSAAGIEEDRIEAFMQSQLPAIRKGTVELLGSLKEIDKDEDRKKLGDREYALALMKDAEGKNQLLETLQGAGATMRSLTGGIGALLGAKEFGDKRTRQAAAMNVLIGADGKEFWGQLGGVVPDLALSLIPGGLAAKSARVKGILGKVPTVSEALARNPLLKGATPGATAAQLAARSSQARAGLAGAAAGSGASAAIRTFGQASEEGLGWGESFGLALKQFMITSGVTLAGGTTGVEAVFRRGGVGRGELTSFIKATLKDVPENMTKEGIEEAADELLSFFAVERHINPEATLEDAAESVSTAFQLGAVLGGVVPTAKAAIVDVPAARRADAAGLIETAKQLREMAAEPPPLPEGATAEPETPSEPSQPPPLPQTTPEAQTPSETPTEAPETEPQTEADATTPGATQPTEATATQGEAPVGTAEPAVGPGQGATPAGPEGGQSGGGEAQVREVPEAGQVAPDQVTTQEQPPEMVEISKFDRNGKLSQKESKPIDQAYEELSKRDQFLREPAVAQAESQIEEGVAQREGEGEEEITREEQIPPKPLSEIKDDEKVARPAAPKESPINTQNDPAPMGRATGAMSLLEWRISNATRRFHRAGVVGFEAPDVEGDFGDVNQPREQSKFFFPKFPQSSSKEVLGEMRKRVSDVGLVQAAHAYATGKALSRDADGNIVQEDIDTDFTDQEEVILGELLIDELNLAVKFADNVEVDPMASQQLGDLLWDVAIREAEKLNSMGQGLQAAQVIARLNPERLIAKLDHDIRTATTEDAPTDEEGIKGKIEDEEKNRKKREKKLQSFIEKIDKDVRRNQGVFGEDVRVRPDDPARPTDRDSRSALDPKKPSKAAETIQKIVSRYTSGKEAMTNEQLEQAFKDFGATNEQAQEGAARAWLVRQAILNEAHEKAKLKFYKNINDKILTQLKDDLRRYKENYNKAARFVEGILKDKKLPTDQQGSTPQTILNSYVGGEAMTQETFEKELGAIKNSDNAPLFTPEQIQEASALATVARKEKEQIVKDKIRKQRAQEAASSFISDMREVTTSQEMDFLFGDLADFREKLVKAFTDPASSTEEALMLASGAKGLDPEKRRALLKLANEVRSAPEGTIKGMKAAKLFGEISRTRGIQAMDVATAVWYANILSGVNTQGINLVGSGMHLAFRLAAAIPVNNVTDTKAMLKGFVRGFKEGWFDVKAALTGKDTVRFEDKYGGNVPVLELLRKETNPVLAYARPWRYVFRALKAGDAFFYRTAMEGRAHLAASRIAREVTNTKEDYAAELSRQLWGSDKDFDVAFAEAMDQADAEVGSNFGTVAGDKGHMTDVRRRAYEILEQQRNELIRDEAHKFGLLTTFTNKPEGTLGVIAEFVNMLNRKAVIPTRWGDVPVVRPFIPFVDVVANVANAAIDFSPIGYARGKLGRHIIGKDSPAFSVQERAERKAAGIIGTGILTAIYTAARGFLDDEDPPFAIYGMGPEDLNQRRQLMSSGWRPFTIKFGKGQDAFFVKYNESPLVFGMSLIGGFHDKLRYDKKFDERSNIEKANATLAVMAHAYSDAGFLRSAADLMSLVTGSNKSLKKGAVEQLLGVGRGFVPAQGLARDLLARPFDPTVIDSNSVWASVLRDIPWVQHIGTRPMLNAFGEPIERTGTEKIPIVSRFVSSRANDADWLWLVENKMWLPMPNGEVAIAVAHGSSGQKAKVKRLVEKRQETMGRFASGVLTDDESYELHKRVGPQIRRVVREFREKNPEVSDLDRESIQEKLKERVSKVRSDVKKDLLNEMYREAL